jgi:hypothetical protein
LENTIGIVRVARCDARSVTAAITAMTPTGITILRAVSGNEIGLNRRKTRAGFAE